MARRRTPKHPRRRTLSALCLLSLACAAGSAAAADFELAQLRTRELRLLYQDPQQTYLTPYVARCLLNSLEFQEKILHWNPQEEVTVVLTDTSDYSNGRALASPRNTVVAELSPSGHFFETLPSNERFHSLADHELVHVATMDAANDTDRAWRRFFGGKPRETDEHPETILYNYLATPRNSTPRWFNEGSAVFFETWLAGGIGRAQGGYDEMVFRAMVRDDAHFYDPVGIVSAGTASDFQTMSNAYLYGTRFISYLGLVYSPEKVADWMARDAASDRYYASQFARVFGKPLGAAWADWIAWEHDFQRANLAAVRKFPPTVGQRLSPRALGSVSRAFVDPASNAMVGAFLYPGVVSHVGAVSLADGSVRRYVDVKGPLKYAVSSTAFDPATRTFFYTADNAAYRDLMALDLASGKARMLLKDARIGDLAFAAHERALYGVRHENGYASVVRIPFPYEDWTVLATLPYGQVATDLDVSPDGTRLAASIEEIDAKQYLRVFPLDGVRAGKLEPLAQYDFGTAVPEGFVFSPDGRYLYGSSYYTGVSNLFRFEPATGEIQAITNAETGFFRPIPLADGKLLALEYSGTGFVPTLLAATPIQDVGAIEFLGARIAATHPIVKAWNAGSPADIPLDTLVTSRARYVPLHEMAPDGGYPVVLGYRDGVALGYQYGFADPLHLYRLDVTAAVSVDGNVPADERTHLKVDFRTLDWHARYWHNIADFYDLFGPTKRSRKGDAISLDYRKLIVYDEPRRFEWNAGLAYYTGLDTLPGNQNVNDRLDSLLSGEVGLQYSNTRKSQASVDHEKGFDWTLHGDFDRANGRTYPKAEATFDVGVALPLGNSSIWLYNAAGAAGGDGGDSLANFYFGGFHNNYVDNREVKRYRQYETFPGFGIDALGGQRFARNVLEWNAPPVRFEHAGVPGLYLSYIRPALFVGSLVIDDSLAGGLRHYQDAGVQLDLSFTLLDHLPMSVSLGYAQGFESGGKVDDEWLFSLKVL
jgi:hypothetical protein